MSILWRSICSEVRPYYSLLQSFPNFPILVTSYPDTLTNVTQMKSHCQLVFVKKIRPRLLEQRPQNESATSVFRQTLAMVLILVVCLFLFSLFILCIDLANPAKCIQRKYRCTFVKFHRQTAPLGPGHTVRTGTESSLSNPPSPNSISAPSPSSRLHVYHPPQLHQSEEDFILGPPPAVVPTMADALYGATPFTFPPLYPTNDLSGDYGGKYRAHADLFASTRSGIPASSSTMGSGTLSPNLYDPRAPSSWLGWGQQDPTDAYQQQQRHADLISDSALPPPSLSPISSSMNGNHSYLPSVGYA